MGIDPLVEKLVLAALEDRLPALATFNVAVVDDQGAVDEDALELQCSVDEEF